jgi:cold shock CspA family protein
MYEGEIATIVADRGFGFIRSPHQPDVFFHASDLAADLEFDEQLLERRVEFDLRHSAKGPRANNVRAAD